MRAERVGSETMLAQIVAWSRKHRGDRAPIQRLADKVAAYFVRSTVRCGCNVVAGGTRPEPRFAYALINAVAVLIYRVSLCLGLATPMSIMVAVGRGASPAF